jgi:hypothetical protein
MQQILLTLLKTLGSTLLGMLTALFTEKFLKRTIIAALEKIVDRTESDLDNRLLQYAKEAWGEVLQDGEKLP